MTETVSAVPDDAVEAAAHEICAEQLAYGRADRPLTHAEALVVARAALTAAAPFMADHSTHSPSVKAEPVATFPPGHPDSREYRLTDGSVAHYPHGKTRHEWEEDIGTPSYEHAKELPDD